ncbi:hypothetical protein FHX57_000018 [Paraburkholderia tropica]|uniref:hypothetical protein n=1 Tax=Paraburkholderia tropica TaxID=92647 RepID=UPI0017BB252A|nr:hypothetical protein [Paraburkholderia tropica]MBB2997705.1 hypothetical protein [Paraburkholderia tropica]MBB6316727.1 hypothetical protein [Paraburkholderia tropica]
MSLRSTSVAPFDALPNPRGGSVPFALAALAQALAALDEQRDVARPLRQATRTLRDAGWLAAARFADTLLLASPLALAASVAVAPPPGLPVRPAHEHDGPDDSHIRTAFRDALIELSTVLERRNLRELACSPALYAHQRALVDIIAEHAPGVSLAYEDVALHGRPIVGAILSPQPAQRLAQARARFEAALLPALKARLGNGSRAANALAEAAFDEMDACFAELTGSDPYDFWRLAVACGRALRRGVTYWGDEDVRRFYARCNLLLSEHARGLRIVPQSFVRTALALLWRDYALFGASADDTADVELLHDYGLTVDWHVAGTQASEALWEAGSAQAGALAARVAPSRDLGALVVNGNAYEDFLQTADAAMLALGTQARALSLRADGTHGDPATSLLAAEAAYRIGAAAWALGLGHVALLADALGLAWRRAAHATSTPAARDAYGASTANPAPSVEAIEYANESLRAMLHKVAAGVAQPDATPTVRALGAAIASGAGSHSSNNASNTAGSGTSQNAAETTGSSAAVVSPDAVSSAPGGVDAELPR